MRAIASYQGGELLDMGGVVLLKPSWPAPSCVNAYVSTRQGGTSFAPYDTLNLAFHVSDDPSCVRSNRKTLARAANLDEQDFCWLEQVHGTRILDASVDQTVALERADGAFSVNPGSVCVVMTADCLPVLLCDKQGHKVMAVHAGWKGLACGIVEAALESFDIRGEVLVWMGPAIGRHCFEVGAEVREAFVARDSAYCDAFVAKPLGTSSGQEVKYLADIYQLCRVQLALSGVSDQNVYGGDFCTYTDQEWFYSYRRDGAYSGRMAAMIWLES